ncbi:MAG: DUF4252 domain-containing protein [Cyclobacteriaceae bacterium]|nr:DUF4252 domain-containing protein [Cyclobacteriaceae bacterium]
MKKLFVLSILLLCTLAASAQNDAISKFFSKYENDDSFTQVVVTARMFGLFANLDAEDPEDQEVIDAVSKVKGLKILTKDNISNGKEMYADAFKMIDSKEYEELMTVKDRENDMKFLIKEKGGTISELLMVLGGEHEFLILSLVGDIDLKQISKLSKSMDIEGFENLEKLDKNN